MEEMPEPPPVGDTTTRACLHFATPEALWKAAVENGGVATCPRVLTRITKNTPSKDGEESGDVLELEPSNVTVEIFDKCRAEVTPSVFAAGGFTAAGACMMQRYVTILPTRQA